MSADTARDVVLLDGIESRVEAAAGVALTGEQRQWWGSRIYWRRPPQRRWDKALLLDVHPFDYPALEGFLRVACEQAPAEQLEVQP